MHSLTSFSLVEIRDMLAKGDVRPSEVTQACIERIQTTDPVINATLPPLMEESAMEMAEALEKTGPDASKPLWGVPLAIKDCICVAGHPATCASRMLQDFTPFYDAYVVERLREAGAILLAKTNMDEFAMGSTTETSAVQATLNPWGCDRIPGGSSGGSAASVAAKQVYGSLASDTGGSIRQPAAMCGCVGIKPTYGRVSRYGVIGYGSSLDQVGTLARTVPDAALLLQTIAGYDPREATSAQVPVEDYLATLAAKQDLKGLRIGLPKELWTGSTPEVEQACRRALDEARKLGAELVDVSLPHTRHAVAAYYILAPAEASTNLARFDGVRYGLRDKEATELNELYVRSRSQGLGEEVKRRILLGTFVLSAGYYDAYYRKAAQVRRLIVDDFTKVYAQCDILAAPSSPMTAWPLGELADDPLKAYMRDALTIGLNLAGLPGLSMPVGLGAESKLPVGMQIMGPAFGEGRVLQTANILSQAMPVMGEPHCLVGL